MAVSNRDVLEFTYDRRVLRKEHRTPVARSPRSPRNVTHVHRHDVPPKPRRVFCDRTPRRDQGDCWLPETLRTAALSRGSSTRLLRSARSSARSPESCKHSHMHEKLQAKSTQTLSRMACSRISRFPLIGKTTYFGHLVEPSTLYALIEHARMMIAALPRTWVRRIRVVVSAKKRSQKKTEIMENSNWAANSSLPQGVLRNS